MEYIKATFKKRPNRFIAEVDIDGCEEIAYVPNTGRCKELLVPGTVVYLLPSNDSKRKTKFTLHFVENRGHLVSLYSQEANQIVFDAIENGKIKELSGYSHIQREKTIHDSRIDIYLANFEEGCCGMVTPKNECYVEVKGVTLVVGTEARFPDAPTKRGSKHLRELIKLKKEGFRAVVFFLIQHPLGDSFRPNWDNDPEFSQTLKEAHENGVEILVYKTINTLEGIYFESRPIEFNLSKP